MSDGSLPLLADETRAAAVHGSWCPKLCNHACPVLAATGRNDAVPWGFHRTVADLADGHTDEATAAGHLHACSGCLGCQVPCEFDQDVPAQVRAGRAAVATAGHPLPGTDLAVERVSGGGSPYGTGAPHVPTSPAEVDVTVLVGCRDDDTSVQAAATLFAAAGRRVRFVAPAGCCGATLRDLGAADTADERSEALALAVTTGDLVALDPHCLPELPDTATDVLTELARLLDDGSLRFVAAEPSSVTYHDPCLLARAARPVTEEPRRLLAAAGYRIAEPEGREAHTVCSGAGLALELVDEPAADATADRRRAQLAATGAPAATACSGARHRLAADGTEVLDLLTLLAARVTRTTT